MKINARYTRLAIILNAIHILCRLVTFGLNLAGVTVSPMVYYTLSFIAEITYILVILYLIMVLKYLRDIPTMGGMIAFLVLGLISFGTGIAVNLSDYVKNHMLAISGTSGILLLLCVVLMFITSFGTKPIRIGAAFRIFFISIVLVALVRGLVPALLLMYFELNMLKTTAYFQIISLIPALTIFFPLRRISLLLSADN